MFLCSMMYISFQILIFFHLTYFTHGNIAEDENSLGLCKGDQYVKGQWVLDSKPREKSFFCCSNGDMGGGNPSCSGTHENYGRKHFSYEDLVVAPGSACICDLMAETRDSVSERESYDWVPESCRWEKTFTGSQFCKVLGKRRLLMIGDSLVHQLASTLVNILKTRDAPCLDQISFGVSNHLKYEANHPPHVTRFDGNQNIRHFFSQNSGADICLINAGAHLEDGGDLFDIWETISPWLKEYKATYNTTFLWLSQSYGHLNCGAFEKPLREFTPITQEEYATDKYLWRNFPHFDHMSKDLANIHDLGFFDISMLRLRPDAHKANRIAGKEDCLHWCFPGPLDVFPIILFNKLSNGEI